MNLRIREVRKNLHMSQTDLAEATGTSLRTVGAWERSESVPNVEQLWKCATVLHTDPNDLLGWYEEHPEDRPAAPAGAEGELIHCYRQSSEKRRSKILETARDQAELSQAPTVSAEGEGLDRPGLRSA